MNTEKKKPSDKKPSPDKLISEDFVFDVSNLSLEDLQNLAAMTAGE
jgi:hypothetical protein